MHKNILVEHLLVDNDIKIVGIIEWEFSHTGTLFGIRKLGNQEIRKLNNAKK